MKKSAITEEFEEIKTDVASVEEIEQQIIKEHSGQIKGVANEAEVASTLLEALNREKEEGETNADFEKRLRDDISKLLGIELS